MLPFDEILTRYLGELGWYQWWVLFLMCYAEMPVGFHQLVANFLAASPSHHCSVPGLQTWRECRPIPAALNMSVPWTALDGGGSGYSQCLSSTEFWQTHSPESLSAGGTLSCDRGWEYDCETFTSTIVTEWDLVCSNKGVRQLTTSLYMVGVALGALGFGDLSDRIGRRWAYLLSLAIQFAFGAATAFSPNVVLFIIFRMFVGAATSGVVNTSAVMVAEFVGPSERVKVGVLRPVFFSVGAMILAGIAFGVRDWRALQLAISLPNLLFIPFYWWCPESPRWLLSRDKEKAKALIQKMAKMNRVDLPDHVFADDPTEADDTRTETDEKKKDGKEKEETHRSYTFLDILRTPNTRKRSLIIFFIWFTNNIVYYGIALNITDLSGSVYANSLLGAAVEVPAYLTLLFLQERFGRKLPVFAYLLLTGIGLIITAALPAGPGRVAVAMISRFCITGGFQSTMIYTVELFPTVTRNIGMGFSSTAGRIGSIVSPFVWLLADLWRPAPYILFGVMTVLAGLLCMLLPETKGQQLPQTLEDGEEFGKG
ncbi:PREDICTED: organic cation transporter protein-like [Branchiostoma belcheri]|uniref:Organic cation transporter protein-like n=1 Tax=Branchiostoma belcheri TaxID=7741 RepID=A0A6P5ABF0_BRABE|nr:PREDICTED: organic cation transporter protein-like [Branchiostoma belcheri]